MKTIIRCVTLSMPLLAICGCMQTDRYDSAGSLYLEYTQRTDTVTMTAGNAQAVNTRIQELDPWPRGVGNTRIPISGQRMAGAVERYRDVSQQNKTPEPLTVESTRDR